MKHLLLKFNHGVEIGARLAYLGHYKATGDQKVLAIANEELHHMNTLAEILEYYNEKPIPAIDNTFKVVGTIINLACQISPKFMMNFIAKSMELFAVVNYSYLSTVYPEFEYTLKGMAKAELEHETYFTKGA